MKDLMTNPYSFDSYRVVKDAHGRATVKAKIMKVGKLKYEDPTGKVFYGDITLNNLKTALPTAKIKPVTLRHPPNMLTPYDVKKYNEGTSADNAKIEDILNEKTNIMETWLTNDLILQSEKAVEAAENGDFGVSAGYLRNAIPKEGNILDFTDIDINHIAIGCKNPRAEGASFSLDNQEIDVARVYSYGTPEASEPKQQTKKEVEKMERILSAVKVGDFSLDEAPINYEKESKSAIDTFRSREEKLVKHIETLGKSFDEKEQDLKKEKGDLTGANKVLEAKLKEAEKSTEGMVSMDEVEKRVEELAEIRATAKELRLDIVVKDPIEGKKEIIRAKYPEMSFDDSEVNGIYKTLKVNKKDTQQMIDSNKALDKKPAENASMDSTSVPMSKVDISELKKLSKKN